MAAAAALASLLPSATKLKATMLDASDAPTVPLTEAVVVSFVGETSADLAVVQGGLATTMELTASRVRRSGRMPAAVQGRVHQTLGGNRAARK